MKKNDVGDNDDENEKCERTKALSSSLIWCRHVAPSQKPKENNNNNNENWLRKKVELKWMEHMIDIWICVWISCVQSQK